MFESVKNTASVGFDLCADGPVLISSGKSNKTDPTLPDNVFMKGIVGKDGEKQECYVIPGSTVKGVIRHYVEDNFFVSGPEEAEALFGKIKGTAQKSKIKFNDAYAVPETVSTSIRHSTAIDPWLQSAKGGSLNNMEVIEKGTFKASFTVRNFTDREMEVLLLALFDINTGAVRFGGRKSRGFGQMRVENFHMNTFKGFNSDLSRIDEKNFSDIEEAVKYFRGGK